MAESPTSLISQLLQALLKANLYEYWCTSNPNELVVDIEGCSPMKITVKPVTLPDVSPAEWMDSGLPHPFGWTEENPHNNHQTPEGVQ